MVRSHLSARPVSLGRDEGISEAMISRSELTEIAERAEKATPGPWDVDWNATQFIIAEDGTGRFVANMGSSRSDRSDADSDFITHSRTDIPRLVDTVKELTVALERLANTPG